MLIGNPAGIDGLDGLLFKQGRGSSDGVHVSGWDCDDVVVNCLAYKWVTPPPFIKTILVKGWGD